MKQVLAFVALSTLISCGGGGGGGSGKSGNPLVEFPTVTTDTLSADQKKDLVAKLLKSRPEPRAGSSKVTRSTGKEVDPESFRTGQAKLKDLNSVETLVVLKVDGLDIYSYRIEQDLIKNDETVTVVVTADDTRKIEEELLSSNMSVNGDLVQFSKQETNQNVSTVVNGSVSLSDPCKVNIHFGVKSFLATTREGNIQIPAFAQKKAESCGKTWSREELRRLDLKNVQVCDERTEQETACEQRDMSHLVE